MKRLPAAEQETPVIDEAADDNELGLELEAKTDEAQEKQQHNDDEIDKA